MFHYFQTEVAEAYGVTCAILLQNIHYWVCKSEADEKNYYDGHYWTYNSMKAWERLFPYLSAKQIRSSLDRLRNEGLIITGNFNASQYDRTLWYALTDTAYSMCQGAQFHLPSGANRNAAEGEPIPNNKPNNKPNNNTTVPKAQKRQINVFEKPSLEEVQEVIRDKGYSVDAESFIAFYDSNGWKVGKNPMRSWRSALVTWHKRHQGDKPRTDTPARIEYERF